MNEFQSIRRVMNTAREVFLQQQNGDFSDQLGGLMDSVDPYWEDREDTEMDIFTRQAPVGVGPDGEEETVHTARTPTEDEEHVQEGSIVSSDLLDRGQMEMELEKLED